MKDFKHGNNQHSMILKIINLYDLVIRVLIKGFALPMVSDLSHVVASIMTTRDLHGR